MNAEETEILEFLQTREDAYVSVTDISKFLGRGHKFQKDRNWARPILRRMEIEGLLEANPYGEYRLKGATRQPNEFKAAIRNPGASLGDTTIVRIDNA